MYEANLEKILPLKFYLSFAHKTFKTSKFERFIAMFEPFFEVNPRIINSNIYLCK